jgi:hypothetical protein
MKLLITSYATFFFIFKYLVGLWLIIDVSIKKKTDNLLKSIIIVFSGFSLIILVNFVLSVTSVFIGHYPFYYINFVDFLSITLILNKFVFRTPKGK